MTRNSVQILDRRDRDAVMLALALLDQAVMSGKFGIIADADLWEALRTVAAVIGPHGRIGSVRSFWEQVNRPVTTDFERGARYAALTAHLNGIVRALQIGSGDPDLRPPDYRVKAILLAAAR